MANSDRSYLKAQDWQSFRRAPTDQQKGIPAPAPQTPYPADAPLVDLVPADQLGSGEMPVREALRLRESHRKYTAAPLTLEELSFLLWSAQGVHRSVERNDRTYVLRTVPSAGGRHPFETYVLVNRVEGVAPGLYRYLSIEHKLCLLQSGDDVVEKAHASLLRQYVKNSAVTLYWTVVPYRTEWRYANHSPKIIALDAGHVCQNLYLACTAIGAGTCAIGAYDQALCDDLLGVDGEDEFVIYAATVGKVA